MAARALALTSKGVRRTLPASWSFSTSAQADFHAIARNAQGGLRGFQIRIVAQPLLDQGLERL